MKIVSNGMMENQNEMMPLIALGPILHYSTLPSFSLLQYPLLQSSCSGGLMPYEFKFPDIGEGLTEGEIVKWLIKEGDSIKEGQPLVEVETDKALAEIPSPRTGVVLKILGKEKEIIKVGQVIVVIGEKGEAVAAEPPSRPKSVGVSGELEEALKRRLLCRRSPGEASIGQ
jgi:hypothetical protein